MQFGEVRFPFVWPPQMWCGTSRLKLKKNLILRNLSFLIWIEDWVGIVALGIIIDYIDATMEQKLSSWGDILTSLDSWRVKNPKNAIDTTSKPVGHPQAQKINK